MSLDRIHHTENAVDRLEIGTLNLLWSSWTPWKDLLVDVRSGGINVSHAPGVYEVRYAGRDQRLTIGKASSLRMRLKQGLVRGHGPHSTGMRIRAAAEDIELLQVRWAVTERPAAAEEELHRRYLAAFGSLPKHTRNT